MKAQVFSVPETPAEFEETWLYIYDNWYKEYYSEMMGKGYADY
jgi:DNA gyrase inhibitor GyrI